MVEYFQKWSHRIGYELVIVDPADCFIHNSLNVDLHLEAVPVHLAAFVIVRQGWQGVRGFETEVFRDSGSHLFQDRLGTSPRTWKPKAVAKKI